MRIWRCVHKRFLDEAWTGEGAYLYGGRYNRPGQRIVYASEHPALAVLEVLAGNVRSTDLADWRLVWGDVDVKRKDERKDALAVGADLLGKKWGAVKVPSVVVPGWNVLVDHSRASVLEGEVVRLDPRVWG